MKPGTFLLLVTVAGCSGSASRTDEPDAEYRRLDANIQAIEEFERRKASCAQSGGILRIARSSGARQPARPRDLRRATCDRHGISGY